MIRHRLAGRRRQPINLLLHMLTDPTEDVYATVPGEEHRYAPMKMPASN